LNLDWSRLKAVVLESDDWGLCAWAPDEPAWRALEDTPVFLGRAGRKYAGSTLEDAGDVRALAELLLALRGGDGFPPVLQANTVVANPDYARLGDRRFEVDTLPLVHLPDTPSRWSRPGMWDQVARARESGVWWPELHGLHHLPEASWLAALRRGDPDARRAFDQESPVCAAVDASGEYDSREPREVRRRNLECAVEGFRALMGRAPRSFCPPDYRWDGSLEEDAERLGVTTLQGLAEQAGNPFPPLRRLLVSRRWPHARGARFYMPPRIAFEPGDEGGRHSPVGVEAVARAARAQWRHGRPAVVSSHRVNYVHLDRARAQAGRTALRDLLGQLARDGAVFVTDAEVRSLCERAWSAREIGERGMLVRFYGTPGEPVSVPAPAGVAGAAIREADGSPETFARLEAGRVALRLEPGEYLLEWERR
jgi:hypothetical protein